jgi:acyl-CoA dehydrogenase
MGAAMLLTEPNYGSDLQNATTKGDKTEEGTFKVNGVKMWITHGTPHTPDGQVFLTVTRTVKKPDGSYRSGAAGLSLLLIDSKDTEVVSLEHKLGIHSSPTVQLSMENSPGYLVGEEGKGLTEYTMSLMNAARLAVAAQSVGVSERALREAWAYAEVREQFGTLIKNLPAVRKMLDEIEISTEASRALVYYTAYAVDMMEGYEEKYKHQGLSAKEIRKQPEMLKWGKLAKVLTPFSKLYAAEEANSNAYKAVQVHGGVGFSEEYDVARQYRDARILTIYEGTSQLQVVAAIGGVTEGYSSESSPLLLEQKALRDNAQVGEDLKPFVDKVVQAESKIKELVPFFKEQNKTFKGAYAHEMVWSAAMIFISHLWLQMAGKDAGGNKAHKAKVYINETMSYVLSTDNKLRTQAEVDYVE